MMLERGSCASGDGGYGVGAVCVGGAGMTEEVIEGWAVSVDVGGLALLLVEEMLRLVSLLGDRVGHAQAGLSLSWRASCTSPTLGLFNTANMSSAVLSAPRDLRAGRVIVGDLECQTGWGLSWTVRCWCDVKDDVVYDEAT